jgi:hypothetical protein
MTGRPPTPGELRTEAEAVLERLRRLDRSAHDGGRLTVEAIDAITGALAEFQRRIEETAGTYNHAWALEDVVAARRSIDEARLIVMRFLADLASA